MTWLELLEELQTWLEGNPSLGTKEARIYLPQTPYADALLLMTPGTGWDDDSEFCIVAEPV